MLWTTSSVCSYTPGDNIPLPSSPGAGYQTTRDHPVFQSLLTLFKAANPKLFPPPSFLPENNKGSGPCFSFMPSNSWSNLVLPHLALHVWKCKYNSPSYPQWTTVPKQMIPLLTDHQKVNSSLTYVTIDHSPHFISSYRHFINSHHHKKGEYITTRYFERQPTFT